LQERGAGKPEKKMVHAAVSQAEDFRTVSRRNSRFSKYPKKQLFKAFQKRVLKGFPGLLGFFRQNEPGKKIRPPGCLRVPGGIAFEKIFLGEIVEKASQSGGAQIEHRPAKMRNPVILGFSRSFRNESDIRFFGKDFSGKVSGFCENFIAPAFGFSLKPYFDSISENSAAAGQTDTPTKAFLSEKADFLGIRRRERPFRPEAALAAESLASAGSGKGIASFQKNRSEKVLRGYRKFPTASVKKNVQTPGAFLHGFFASSGF